MVFCGVSFVPFYYQCTILLGLSKIECALKGYETGSEQTYELSRKHFAVRYQNIVADIEGIASGKRGASAADQLQKMRGQLFDLR